MLRFHRPVEDEDGYEPYDAEKAKSQLSSLTQIVSSSCSGSAVPNKRLQTSTPPLPFIPYEEPPPAGLTPSHLSFLRPYLAPSYLSASSLEKLSEQFAAASEIVLHNFLHPDLAPKLKAETEGADKRDYPDTGLPAHDTGEGDGWSVQGPPSKHRYLALQPASSSSSMLQDILSNLLPSPAFRAWLSVVSSLAPTGYRAEARRFRRGLDYTLAAGEDKSGEARLDVWLGASWWADVQAGSDEDDALAEHGGWDCYIAAPDDAEDPAVYQSSQARKAPIDVENGHIEASVPKEESNGNGRNGHAVLNGEANADGHAELEIDPSQLSPSDLNSDSDFDDDSDGPLLTQAVSFNKLLIVLRDPGVMRFVKYLSAGAKGSRWDVGGEWEVGMVEEVSADGEGER